MMTDLKKLAYICYFIRAILFTVMIAVCGIIFLKDNGIVGCIAAILFGGIYLLPLLNDLRQKKYVVGIEPAILNTLCLVVVALHYYIYGVMSLLHIGIIVFFSLDFIAEKLLRSDGCRKERDEDRYNKLNSLFPKIKIVTTILLLLLSPLLYISEQPATRILIYFMIVACPLLRMCRLLVSERAEMARHADIGFPMDCVILLIIFVDHGDILNFESMQPSMFVPCIVVTFICCVDILDRICSVMNIMKM